jgi:hypothetical protein
VDTSEWQPAGLEGSSKPELLGSRSYGVGFEGEIVDGERDQQAERVYSVPAVQEHAQEAQNPPALRFPE